MTDTFDLTGLTGLNQLSSDALGDSLGEVEDHLVRIRQRTLDASGAMIEYLNHRAISPLKPLIEAAAGATEELFRGLVDGSVRSGRAFAAVMLDAVGKFATAMGESMIATASVLQALMALNIPATFTGGFALIAIGSSLSAFAATLGGSGKGGGAPPAPPELPPENAKRNLPAELTINLVNNGGVLGIDNVKNFIADAVKDAIGDDRLVVMNGGVR